MYGDYLMKQKFNNRQIKKVEKVMREFKLKKLTTRGRPVKKRKQAIAIALSEARGMKK